MLQSANLGLALCTLLNQGAIEALLSQHGSVDVAEIPAQAGQRRMDRHDEFDGAAGGIGCRRGALQKPPKWAINIALIRNEDFLSAMAIMILAENIVPSGAGASAGCAGGHARPVAVPRAENFLVGTTTISLGGSNDVHTPFRSNAT